MRTLWMLPVAAVMLAGCATGGSRASADEKDSRMQVSASQPAAVGHAEFSKAKNGNTSIDVEVEHLAQPEKLDRRGNVYVVWAKKDGASPAQNVGALKVDDDLKGTLNTITPLQSFDLFITAEPDGQVAEPTGEKQLWTKHNR